jgi:hypothetical protein
MLQNLKGWEGFFCCFDKIAPLLKAQGSIPIAQGYKGVVESMGFSVQKARYIAWLWLKILPKLCTRVLIDT